jgi:hypothetical protein
MKIVKLTVFVEVPDDVAESWEGEDINDKAANAAIDSLCTHFLDIGMIKVEKVIDESEQILHGEGA